MKPDTKEYVKSIVADLIERLKNGQSDNIIGIKHYNTLKITQEEVDVFKGENTDINFFYHEFDTSEFIEAYEPFLSIIRKLIYENDVDIDMFVDVCEVYSLQKSAVSAYMKAEPVLRDEEYIYNEIEFERQKMCKSIINMFKYFSEQKPIVIVLNKLHRAGSSTIDILMELEKAENCKVGVIFAYNDFAAVHEYYENQWEKFIGELKKKDNLKDWGFNTPLGSEYKSTPFIFYDGKMMEYIEKLEQMYNLVALGQANYFASILHSKIIKEELSVSPANMLLFYELYAKIAIYFGDTASSRIACDAYEKLMQMYPSAIKKYKYYYLLTIEQIYSGQRKTAIEYAYKCKMATAEMGTEYTRFTADLLEHMILFGGWNETWKLENIYKVDEKLLSDAKKYNYINHLAHIYIYAMDCEAELYENIDGIEKRLSNFVKGISIAKELGNTFLISEAYRKNLMIASANGYFKTAKYYITNYLQPMAEEMHDDFQLGNIYNDLGYNSCAIEKYDVANEYFKKALDIFIELKMEEYITETLYNMSVNALMARDYKLCRDCLKLVIKIINIFQWESLRVAHVSKVFGLMGYCQYKLNDLYESRINMNFSEQFLKHISGEKQKDKKYYYLDDDLFLYHICKGVHYRGEKEYRKAEKEFKLSYKYASPNKGGAAFFYIIYVKEIYNLYKEINRDAEAEYEVKHGIRFYEENGLQNRAKELEGILEGKEWTAFDLGSFDENVKNRIKSILIKSESEFYYEIYQKKIKYLSIWQKLQGEEYLDKEHWIKNSITSIMKEFALDKLIMVRIENDGVLQIEFNNIGTKLNNERVKRLYEYADTHKTPFSASKLNKNFFEYEEIADVFDESRICTIIGIPLYNKEKLEAFIFGYVLSKDVWNVNSNRIVISKQEIKLFEFLFRQLMERVEKMEYKKEIERLKKST